MAPRRAAVLRHRATGETLRVHLIAATDELLGSGDLAALTTRLIARHAGVSDGVLYNHFGDKTELVLAAVVRRYTRLLEAFETTVGAIRTGEGSLEAGIAAHALALRDLDADALRLGAGLLADPALLARFWAEIHAAPLGLPRLRGPLRGYLEAERGLGRVDPLADLDAATTLVFGAAAMRALARHFAGGPVPPVDTELEAMARQVARSIAA
jgi:AcrR family transcriptional regulator